VSAETREELKRQFRRLCDLMDNPISEETLDLRCEELERIYEGRKATLGTLENHAAELKAGLDALEHKMKDGKEAQS
jgi:hypothetical protein